MIHLYHGDGKGKTTAAIGLCVRAWGAGKRVVFLQFMKGNETSELKAFEKLPGLRILRNETDYGFYKNMTGEEKRAVKEMHDRNLEQAFFMVRDGECDTLILDEVTYAYAWELLDRKRLVELLEFGKKETEMVLTGRRPDKVFIELADYITNMQCERHPFERGIRARKGVEY